MADKHRDLKTMVQGQGLSALAPGPRPESIEPDSVSESQPNAIEGKPTSAGASMETPVTIPGIFTLHNNQPETGFQLGQSIQFKVECAVTDILASVRPEYQVELIAIDMRTQNPQPLYCFTQSGRVETEAFGAGFEGRAALAGVYRMHAIFSIKGTKYHAVAEGASFMVY